VSFGQGCATRTPPVRGGQGEAVAPFLTKRFVNSDGDRLNLVAIIVIHFAAAPVLADLWHYDPLKPARLAARRVAVLEFLEPALLASSGRNE
jgi:hypothetical protein